MHPFINLLDLSFFQSPCALSFAALLLFKILLGSLYSWDIVRRYLAETTSCHNLLAGHCLKMWMRYGHEPHNHWAFIWVPVFGAFIWFGMLLAMLITWLATGRPRYPSMTSSIAYISDVGASYLQPLFIVGCCITSVSFVLSLALERWLRHSGRLLPNMRRRERVLASLAILGSVIGGVGLILLSIFNTVKHSTLHRTFLLVFMVGVVLSAIFTIMEFRWVSKDFAFVRTLRHMYIAKAVIASILICLSIAFAVTLFTTPNAGAVLEWLIAFGFTFYLLTFSYDFRQTKGMHKGDLSREHLMAQGVPKRQRWNWSGQSRRGRGAQLAPEMGQVPQEPGRVV